MLFDFLSIAGRCKKPLQFIAYIVGCAVVICLAFLIFVFANNTLEVISKYAEVIIDVSATSATFNLNH